MTSPARHDGSIAARIRFRLLTALNAGAALTLLFAILDRSPATRFPLADFGAFYGGRLLFVLIPLGLAGLLLLGLAPGAPAPTPGPSPKANPREPGSAAFSGST